MQLPGQENSKEEEPQGVRRHLGESPASPLAVPRELYIFLLLVRAASNIVAKAHATSDGISKSLVYGQEGHTVLLGTTRGGRGSVLDATL